MTSFKVKLAFYFVLLAVLPLAVLSWDFARAESASERRLVDARLEVELRAALAAYRLELDAAAVAGKRIASSRALALAFRDSDRAALARITSTTHAVVIDARGHRFGTPPRRAAVHETIVTAHGRRLGSVDTFVALDPDLIRRLARRAGFAPGDALAFGGADAPALGRAEVTEQAGKRLRRLAAPLPSAPNTRILVLTPQRAVEAATAAAWRRLALAVLAALLFVCAVGYLEGKRIVRAIRSLVSAAHSIARGRLYERAVVHGRDELATLGHAFNDMAEQLEGRVEDLNAERARLREVISGFGAALAATHHDQELRRVIVATAVEATAARGGKFISTDGALVECGDTDAGDRFELVVATRDATFGTLVLVGDAFSDDDADTAWSLAAQAAVALDNARLHAIVARQALTDGLTGLDNRRQAEHAVAAEVARVARYGGSFAVVLADIDEFKVLNDTYGHAAGDAVLREIALVLGGAVRDSDVASRWGGEEFLLLLRETELDGAVQLAERVRRELERRTILSPGGAPLRVTASFGVAACTTNEGPFEVVSAADEALYAAKRQGRNRVVGSAGQAEPRSCSAPTREDAAV